MSVWAYIQSGGTLMYALIFCAGIGAFIIFDKWLYFHREQINVGKLMSGLFNVLKRDGFVEAMTLCDTYPGPVARILSAAIQGYQRDESEAEIKQRIEAVAMTEMPRLECYMKVLSTLAYVTPLLGLLGTVLGMMSAFDIMSSQKEALVISDLSAAIAMAMVTTAAGLTVAIPCYIAYNYLYSRINMIVFEMEKAAIEMLAFFREERQMRDASGKTE